MTIDWGSTFVGVGGTLLVGVAVAFIQQWLAKRDATQQRTVDNAQILGALQEAVNSLKGGMADVVKQVRGLAGQVSDLRDTLTQHTTAEEARLHGDHGVHG